MNDEVSFSYETREQDILTALAVIDFQNAVDSRQPLHLLGVALVLWIFIPETVKNPQNPVNWLMMLLTLGVGVFVWKGAAWQNRRFARSLSQSQPMVTAAVDTTQLSLQSADGASTYLFDQPIRVYAYQNVLAINGGRKKINAIPIDQLSEEVAVQLRKLLSERLGDQFETVEQLSRRRR